MGRTREFDPEIALEEAMRLFWEKGYHDTSVRDLVARTGVSHAGMYGTFGNKREVFSAALRRYHEQIMGKVLETLEAPDASLPEITGHFERLYELAKDSRFRAGCMICNSAVDLAQEDPEVANGFQRHLDRLVAAFRKALARAKERVRCATIWIPRPRPMSWRPRRWPWHFSCAPRWATDGSSSSPAMPWRRRFSGFFCAY